MNNTGDTKEDRSAPGELRKSLRYPIAVQRGCQLCIITFKDLAWMDHTAFLKDISTSGIGLECSSPIEVGFAWFKDRVAGHRSGVLLWSRQVGPSFRAGVQFVPLSREAEHFVQAQVDLLRSHQPLLDPEAVLSTIMRSLPEQGPGRRGS